MQSFNLMSVSLGLGRRNCNKQEECHWSLETVMSTSDLSLESLRLCGKMNTRHTERKNPNKTKERWSSPSSEVEETEKTTQWGVRSVPMSAASCGVGDLSETT